MEVRVKITRPSNADCGKIVSVPLEEYLRDVLPSEIKAGSCHLQAQCAQAIAARTYALRKLQECVGKAYDVDDTANYQAYKARPRHANSDLAVSTTQGKVLISPIYDLLAI